MARNFYTNRDSNKYSRSPSFSRNFYNGLRSRNPQNFRSNEGANHYGPQNSRNDDHHQFNSQQDNRNKQEEIFQTPVAGVSPFLIRQLQSNNPTNPFTINSNQQIQHSGSTLASQETQNINRINSTGMAHNFSSPGLSHISFNSHSPGVNSNNDISHPTITNSSTLNPNATPFIPKYHNQVNIPPFTQVSSPSVSQQNPFMNNTSTTGGLMNGNSAQGTQSYPLHPTNFQFHSNSQNPQNHNSPTFNYQNYQMNALAFSDIQKHKLQTFNNRLKELDNEHNHIMKCRKRVYPDLHQ